MTHRAVAAYAAGVYKETQPAIDALKDTIAANEAAKKTLGAYMIEKNLDVFCGVTLAVATFEGWDTAKLREYLGDKVADFRTRGTRKHFGLARRPSRNASNQPS